ncbi:CaiB/BaiF CoA transferase family protein [Paralcaligenes ureilyticus]|uniref:Crotonobetainyl-CoA:carnitine CoA-transferase CaiB-like acyl-CoA transferase n=1 Tax=Paralcaligenes ureilyticus TaxID=627131 RepID=A0A4R3M122_9BURK|nr:CaiB/BaiF CoA-transferase family protein [Paralcaligenes ureilyticus]TCT04817.1 crotonobetainyl-CoA:carnitine CoA-transferase CaiB-like acyl-CoA transferase [Paralcaligenes ureilyticus]
MSLEHIVVLDLTHMLSGPYGTMLLADLGARTIKIEPPITGEGTRRLQEHDSNFSREGMGAYFLTLNRNKESVCIDLKNEIGKAVFLDLVRKADVVFDNFSVGVTERLGIDYQTLSKVNPRIITCSVTGFGQTGPDPKRPAFDQVVQGMGGGMSITGTRESGPIRSGIPIGDLGGGIFGAMGVLAAIAQRDRTGEGQHVDISMLDSQISLLNYMATMYLMSGIVPSMIGNGHFVHVPYNCYPTSDGHIIIACIGDQFFAQFAQILDLPTLKKPEYLQQQVRFAAKTTIDAIISDELKKQTTEHWLELLQAARIPCGPVNNFEQALNDTQVQARNMVINVSLKTGETVRMPGNPIKLSAAKNMQYAAPPDLGEHTRDVLQDLLGYAPQKVAQLQATGAIA